MAQITIHFNDNPIQADSNKTILQVAADNGVKIPTLCHDEKLAPFGSCFVCVVEVEGARSFMAACATKVAAGMRIRTHSETIAKARKMALELLLSNHYADCKAPCVLTCPASVDVQGYIALIANKQYRDALALVKETNPFPLSIGRVCTRPCEGKCRRGIFDAPVAIDYLKRFIADYDLKSGSPWLPEVKNRYAEKVAVIGAGPAGMTAAYYLAIEGYKADVYERLPQHGGMLRYGIPEYRLPKSILDAEIGLMLRLDIDIHYNRELGRDFTIADLKRQGYKAVLLAIGAQKGTPMHITGENMPGVLSGVEFLCNVALGKKIDVGERVAVIGGGNTAMDAARTSLRLGAKHVYVLYRRTRHEMPANEVEIEEAVEEGIDFRYLTAPVAIEGNGKAERVSCIKMELGEPDASGRRRPVPVTGSEFAVEIDTVISAIGQAVDSTCIGKDAHAPAMSKWGTFVVDEATMATNIDGVFAMGDAVSGPKTAIEAIAMGGKAAKAVHSYLQTGVVAKPKIDFNIKKDDFKTLDADDFAEYEKSPREKMALLTPAERRTNFKEIEQGYSEDQALREAMRCLECGCKDVFECDLRAYAGEYKADVTAFMGNYKNHAEDNHHPYIRIEPNKCINCARCVRVCDEVQHINAWGFVKRGFDSLIKPNFEDPLLDTDCETCGQCVQTCPVGALTEKNPALAKPGPWKEQENETVCHYCAVGCPVQVHTVGERIVRISGKEAAGSGWGNLCVRGRFGYEYLYSPERLTTPLYKKNGRFSRISWEEADALVAERINAKTALQFIVGETLPTKVYTQAKQLKIPAYSFSQNAYANIISALKAADLHSRIGATAEDMAKTDLLIVFAATFQHDNPVLLLQIIQHLKQGKALVCIGPELDPKLTKYVKTGLVQHINVTGAKLEKLLRACNALLASERSIFIPGMQEYGRELQKTSKPDADMLSFLSRLRSSARPTIIVATLPDSALQHMVNFVILSDKADALRIIPVGVRCNSAGWILSQQFTLPTLDLNRPLDVLVTMRQDPLGAAVKGKAELRAFYAAAKFKITADVFLTETAKASDLVLPLAAFAESDGTFFNCQFQSRRANKIVPEHARRSPIAVMNALFAPFGAAAQADITAPDEIARLLAYRDAMIGKKLRTTQFSASGLAVAFAYGADCVEQHTWEKYFTPRIDAQRQQHP